MMEALDSRLVLKGPLHGKFGEISVKVNHKILCTQIFNSGKMDIVYYIPVSVENQREILMMIQMLGGKKISDVWNIKLNEDENTDLRVILDFIKIPSIVLDAIYAYRGEFIAYMRFNNSDLNNVSETLLENIAMEEEYSVDYLGEANGTFSDMKSISEEIPLFVMEVISNPPLEELQPENNPMGKSWRRIIKSLSPDDLISAVCVTDELVSIPSFSLINQEKQIYLGSVKNPLLVYLNREFNEKGIVTFSRTQSLRDSLFRMNFVISADQVNQVVRVMGKMFRTFPEWNCRISFASRLEDATEKDLLVV
ncbi:hypothetical protein OXIME_000823 [Oxyplasma meridianum]|uniref:Uncharacterized protein n=1 Tax=Oxyplasma meridianum TaxID=3073602 RepID=A0AAX4NGL0_9ARCH